MDYCDNETLKLFEQINNEDSFESVINLYKIFVLILLAGCLLSLILNTLLVIIGTIIQSKLSRLNRSRSPILLLSLNLAATDSIASFLVGFGLLINSFLPTVFDINLTNCFKLILEIFRISALIASALHLLALALVHYKGIVNPLHYRSVIFCSQHRTRSIYLMSFVCWLLPSVVIASYFCSIPCQGFQHKNCRSDFMLTFRFRFMILITFFIPLVFMLYLYIKIFIIIKRHQKQRLLKQNKSFKNHHHHKNSKKLMMTATASFVNDNQIHDNNNNNDGQMDNENKNKNIDYNDDLLINNVQQQPSSSSTTKHDDDNCPYPYDDDDDDSVIIKTTTTILKQQNISCFSGDDYSNNNRSSIINHHHQQKNSEQISNETSSLNNDNDNDNDSTKCKKIHENFVLEKLSNSLMMTTLSNNNNDSIINVLKKLNNDDDDKTNGQQQQQQQLCINDKSSITTKAAADIINTTVNNNNNNTTNTTVATTTISTTKTTTMTTTTTTTTTITDSSSNNAKALITTLSILGTYILCWMPAVLFFALTCIDNDKQQQQCYYPINRMNFRSRVVFSFITNGLVIFKAIIDPFIYTYRMKEMKNALNRWLHYICPFDCIGYCCPTPSPSSTSPLNRHYDYSTWSRYDQTSNNNNSIRMKKFHHRQQQQQQQQLCRRQLSSSTSSQRYCRPAANI